MGLFGTLPQEAELSRITHEQATLILAADGTRIGKLFAQDRTNVRYEDLPEHLVQALVATEDARFFAHGGVDGRSYIRVFFRTLLGGDRRGGGGSTISQQIVKNLYGRQRHGLLTVPVNKIKEALVARRLERVLDKNEVLVLYFNSVPFGENTFGIEAAAQRFFGKPTRELRVEEGAVLVGMLKANTTYNPRLHPEAARGRRDQVLELMEERGHLSAAAHDSLRALPLRLRYTGGDAFDRYGYFNVQVAKEARRILSALEKRTGGQYDLEKDGLRITTTLDPVLQREAEAAAHAHLATMQPRLDKELRQRKVRAAWEKAHPLRKDQRWRTNATRVCELYEHKGRRLDTLSFRDSLWHYHRMLHGAVLMMDPASGAVKAWVGGNDHRHLPFDLITAGHSVASTIKPFLYAAALADGLNPCTYLDNAKRTYEGFDDWSPDNFDRDTVEGAVALWYALARSMNRPTVDLYFRTDREVLRRTLSVCGLPVQDIDHPAFALGASDVTLRELVTAYGAFATGGRRVEPVLITRITDAGGRVLYQSRGVVERQALDPAVAHTVNALLRRAVDQGTGAALRSRFGLTASVAGKTGTAQDQRDAWFVAYTPGIVVGSWVGAYDRSVHFNSTAGTGAQLALPIVGAVLQHMEKDGKLRKTYMRPFATPEAGLPAMDCPAYEPMSGLRRVIEDVFRPGDRERKKKERKKEKDSFLERLFRRKKG